MYTNCHEADGQKQNAFPKASVVMHIIPIGIDVRLQSN